MVSAALCVLMVCGCSLVMAGDGPKPADAQPAADAAIKSKHPLTKDKGGPYDPALLAKWVLDDEVQPARRVLAARHLVRDAERGEKDAYGKLLELLSKDTPSAARAVVLDAIRKEPLSKIKTKLAEAVFEMQGTLTPELEARWAAVLGRWEIDKIAKALIKTAQDKQADDALRRQAILALGEHRQLASAKALIGLIGKGQPEAVQNLAFDALASLSHQPGLGRKAAVWAKWYQSVKGMNPRQWRAMLHQNLLKLSRQNQKINSEVRERLIQAQRALYRASSADQQPALLVQMLKDPLDIVRTLALDLARQRAEDNGEFGEDLRAELRARLSDPLATVRAESAMLLGQLLDAKAADAMAQLLAMGQAAGQGDETAVTRAYLTALTQMPRAKALEPAYELLKDEALRPTAAGLLAASQRAGHGDQAAWAKVLKRVRDGLAQAEQASPQMVTLFGLLLKADDKAGWARIGGWLDDKDDRVRESAARAWSDAQRSLAVLAERCDDTVIRPIALKAIAERGKTKQTLKAVAGHRPKQADDIRLWEKAMVAMAPRVAPGELLDVIDSLADNNGETRQARETMLTASIDRKDKPKQPTRDDLRLLIARAQTRVLSEAPALVVLDYEAALKNAAKLTNSQADQARRGLINAYLADGRAKDALATAAEVLKPGGKLVKEAAADPLIGKLVAAAGQAVEQGNKDQAKALLAGVRTLLGETLPEKQAGELKALEDKLDKADAENNAS